jgi:hypothetical protein
MSKQSRQDRHEITQANRQDIVTTSARNEGLANGIAEAFIKAKETEFDCESERLCQGAVQIVSAHEYRGASSGRKCARNPRLEIFFLELQTLAPTINE